MTSLPWELAAGNCSRARVAEFWFTYSLVPASHAVWGHLASHRDVRTRWYSLATPTAHRSKRATTVGLEMVASGLDRLIVESCSDSPRSELGLDSGRTDWRGRFAGPWTFRRRGLLAWIELVGSGLSGRVEER